MAIDGAVTTSLVLSSPVNKHVTGHADRPPGRQAARPPKK
jgi:Lrp/AsnC family leucine-responsive transcriptional regulator